jgi:lambda repressor-like predicted transcriptional regulator
VATEVNYVAIRKALPPLSVTLVKNTLADDIRSAEILVAAALDYSRAALISSRYLNR